MSYETAAASTLSASDLAARHVANSMPQPALTGGAALVPDDDYYDQQWHFDFLGDIEAIWAEYDGSGVHVAVYDDGLDTTHPDLAENYDPTRQVIVGGVVIDPLQAVVESGFAHGAAVAGLIGAGANGFGTVGVAHGASLTGVTIFSGPADINAAFDGFMEAVDQSENFYVINHSWGRFPASSRMRSMSTRIGGSSTNGQRRWRTAATASGRSRSRPPATKAATPMATGRRSRARRSWSGPMTTTATPPTIRTTEPTCWSPRRRAASG